MADKYVTENKSGLWTNDRKTDDWMDDFGGKIYVAKSGWHWIGAKEQEGDNKPALQVELRPMTDDQTEKYCSDYSVLTKAQAKEKWSKQEEEPAPTKKTESDDDLPF